MFRPTVYLLSSQAANVALALLSGVVINHTLGPSGRGDYAELIAWSAVLVAVFGISVNNILFHFANKARYAIERNTLTGTIVVCWLGSTILMACAIAALILFGGPIAS